MPTELLGELAKHLISDDPAATARNLTNFKATSRSVQHEFENGGAVGEFHTRLNRLGTSAQALYTAAMPAQDDLPDLLKSRYLTRTAGPILTFQNATRKSAVADKILALTDQGAEARALSKIADNLGNFSQVDRTRLLDRSVELFAATAAQGAHGQWSVLINTARALKKGHEHLNDGQRERLNGSFAQDPYAGALYRAIQVRSTGRAVPQPNPDLDRNIDAIGNRANGLPPERSYGQANEIAQIGTSINESYDSARAELMRSDRGRELAR
ncbi:hypothetical protein C7I87_23990 [Mesorhizobium sp. SARCC-RB16n]|uniref:hypothetical protein n=1 Tax=Mesorhizobium sp. SARCC-RB16n TaxID=2116687 RepID=UPI00122F3C2F|nr:hypothetical protein [Mesorhizobium sp. SARCC-RB16n]KAA3448007.1 hypothetical protein C7I87_23990 [Mesorhizobium sp. SARCC-RB16n]